jgi:hypothetical protein
MKNTKLSELKELEKLATKIAKKKAKLEQQLAADKEQAKWYDEMLKESGFKSPRALLKAMMEHFGIRTVSLVKAKGNRGPGRPPKAAAKAPATKRKRTKVGLSKNAASRKFGISYVVIKKIVDGGYDKL